MSQFPLGPFSRDGSHMSISFMIYEHCCKYTGTDHFTTNWVQKFQIRVMESKCVSQPFNSLTKLLNCGLHQIESRVENTENGENAGCQHFLPFPSWFQKASSLGSFKNTDF